MYIVVGLGNPGKEYANTRHNTGFMFIDKLADKHNISVTKEKFKALIGDGIIEGKKVLLVKPQTFMNLSGDSLIEIVNFYKEDVENIIVAYDDIDLEVGKLRLRSQGSAGTHNGMKSVIGNLGTTEIKRIRIGIGKPNIALVDYVLGNFSKADKDTLDVALDDAVKALEITLAKNINSAMEIYNGK